MPPLSDTPGPLEGVPIVSTHPISHGFPIPISGQESADLGSHPVTLQYLQGVPPIQCVIGLVDIHKYLIHDLLLHA